MSDSSETYAYQGAQDQSSGMTDINTLTFLIRTELTKINTAAVVKVMKAPYDAQGNPIAPGSAAAIGYIDVQPLVNQLDGYGNATPHGTVHKLSYVRYQGGNGSFISDPVVGDIGKMIVASRDTSAVRATSQQSNPGSRRQFDMADGTYMGCSQAGAPTQWLSWTATGFELHDKNGNVLIGNAEGIRVNGILFTRGATGTFRGHTHAQPNDSHGDIEMETNPPTSGT